MTNVLCHSTDNYVVFRQFATLKSFEDDILLFDRRLRNVASFQPVSLNIFNNNLVVFVVDIELASLCYHFPVQIVNKIVRPEEGLFSLEHLLGASFIFSNQVTVVGVAGF